MIIYPLLFRPLLRRYGEKGIPAVTILSCITGLELGAFFVVTETLVSGITELPAGVFLGLMLPIHLAIGAVEGVITAAVFACVKQTRPELLMETVLGNAAQSPAEDAGSAAYPARSLKKTVVMLAVLAALTGGGLSLLASGYPDGLEWSMEKTAGTAELERTGAVHDAAAAFQEAAAVFPDYDFKDGEGTGTSASGLIGGLMTCALAGAAGCAVVLIKRRRKAG